LFYQLSPNNIHENALIVLLFQLNPINIREN
jgi:hypothetical protein